MDIYNSLLLNDSRNRLERENRNKEIDKKIDFISKNLNHSPGSPSTSNNEELEKIVSSLEELKAGIPSGQTCPPIPIDLDDKFKEIVTKIDSIQIPEQSNNDQKLGEIIEKIDGIQIPEQVNNDNFGKIIEKIDGIQIPEQVNNNTELERLKTSIDELSGSVRDFQNSSGNNESSVSQIRHDFEIQEMMNNFLDNPETIPRYSQEFLIKYNKAIIKEKFFESSGSTNFNDVLKLYEINVGLSKKKSKEEKLNYAKNHILLYSFLLTSIDRSKRVNNTSIIKGSKHFKTNNSNDMIIYDKMFRKVLRESDNTSSTQTPVIKMVTLIEKMDNITNNEAQNKVNQMCLEYPIEMIIYMFQFKSNIRLFEPRFF